MWGEVGEGWGGGGCSEASDGQTPGQASLFFMLSSTNMRSEERMKAAGGHGDLALATRGALAWMNIFMELLGRAFSTIGRPVENQSLSPPPSLPLRLSPSICPPPSHTHPLILFAPATVPLAK